MTHSYLVATLLTAVFAGIFGFVVSLIFPNIPFYAFIPMGLLVGYFVPSRIEKWL